MRRSGPPVIATWLLRRFAPGPDTDAVVGDLFEHYQRGRSATWYWREVLVAIATSAWLEVRQHPLRLLGAVAAGVIVAMNLVRTVTPLEYSLLVKYALRGRPVHPEEMPLLVFAMEAPLHVLSAWVAARCAGRCRVPAVVLLAGLSLSSGVFALWMNAQSWPLWAHFSVWPWLWILPADVVLILFGGGLLFREPQRALRT
jgi:hypothetical protein